MTSTQRAQPVTAPIVLARSRKAFIGEPDDRVHRLGRTAAFPNWSDDQKVVNLVDVLLDGAVRVGRLSFLVLPSANDTKSTRPSPRLQASLLDSLGNSFDRRYNHGRGTASNPDVITHQSYRRSAKTNLLCCSAICATDVLWNQEDVTSACPLSRDCIPTSCTAFQTSGHFAVTVERRTT